ncbi:MAG TPA: hypothetical protein ENK60_09380 [Anaerolineae bacterium]|nr:hypothetical protein [Anaerolineae bacterium]
MSTTLHPPQQPAPDIRLEAVVSGRVINPSQPDARFLVLVFQSQKTARAMAEVQDAVREQFPDARDVRIVSVVDMRGVPRMFRGMANAALQKAYEHGAEHLPEGWDPTEYIVILPDWKGAFFKAFGVAHADTHAAAVVVDGQGIVLGSHQGPELATFILDKLNQATG